MKIEPALVQLKVNHIRQNFVATFPDPVAASSFSLSVWVYFLPSRGVLNSDRGVIKPSFYSPRLAIRISGVWRHFRLLVLDAARVHEGEA